jgi:hypothetical protein
MSTKKCSTPSCPREIKHPRSGLCSACYSGQWYWQKQGVTRVMRRKTQLRILDERLENLRPSNVISLRRRRA